MREAPRPRFRPDLVVRRVVESGDAGYTVHDPVTEKYFRQDPMTRDLCSLLDGKRTHEEILEELGERYPQYAFTPEFLEETLEGLRKAGFLEDAFHRNLLVQERAKAARQKLLSAESFKNVLQIQLATIDPTPVFRRIYPVVRMMFSRAAVLATTIASLVAMGLLWERRDALVGNLYTIFSLEHSTWIGLAVLYVTLFLIVVAHEFGHGLCCMHYGGQPRKLGFLFFYFMPGMYCDVSDMYFFEKRWPRVAVALAGGYVELQAFCLGTFLWVLTPPDNLIHEIAYRVMLFSGVTGLIFNYNPLVKLDGYFVLMSWLDVPELRERSFAWVKAHLVSLFQRKPPETESATRRERRIFWIYGVASILYTIFFLYISLLIVRNLFVGLWQEVGFVLFALFFLLVTKKLWGGLARSTRLLVMEHAGFIRRKWAYFLAGAAVLVLAFLLPLPHAVQVEARLSAAGSRPVRAPVDGRIAAVLVSEGDPVRRGTVLALVESAERSADRAAVRAAYEGASVAEREQALRERRAPLDEARAAEARWAARDREGRQAWIASPEAGRVLSARPQRRVGETVAEGDSLLAIGRTDTLRVELRVSEREVGDLAVGRRAGLRLRGEPGRTIAFLVEEVDLAPAGRPGVGEGLDALRGRGAGPTWYRARGTIVNPGGRLRPGMSGMARVEAEPRSLAGRLARLYARYVRADFWL